MTGLEANDKHCVMTGKRSKSAIADVSSRFSLQLHTAAKATEICAECFDAKLQPVFPSASSSDSFQWSRDDKAR